MSLVIGLLVLCAATPLAFGASFEEIWVNTEPNDTVLVQKWLNLEKNMKDGAEILIKNALPMLIRTGYDAEISQECMGGVLKLLTGLKDLKLWAVNLFDAFGKPGGGQLEGSLGMFGSYSQCLRVANLRNKTLGTKIPDNIVFRGQYCSIIIRPPLPPKPEIFFKNIPLGGLEKAPLKTELFQSVRDRSSIFYIVTHRIGACVPSVCSKDDVQKVAQLIAQKFEYYANVTNCEIMQEEIKVDGVQLAVFALCVFLILTTLCASILEYFLLNFSAEKEKQSESLTLKLVQAWSLKRNMVKTFSPLNSDETDESSLNCLFGIRFLSIGWVVLIHTYALVEPVIYRDGVFADRFLASFTSQVVSNGGLSVDSFFFMTGLLVTYNVIRLHDKMGEAIFNVPLLLFKRIWRLLPSAMMVMGLATLLPLIHYGPMWNEEVGLIDRNVRQYWWMVPLFITNFFTYDKVPVVSYWYISVDLQCLILALIFLGIYFKNKRAAYIFNGFLFVGSIISLAAVIYFYNLLPTILMTSLDRGIMNKHFLFLHTLPNVHVPVYVIGMFMGVFLAKTKNFKLPLIVEIIGWPTALTIMYATIHSSYIWNSGKIPTVVDSILYGTFDRVAWAIGLAFITLMCATGRGGIIGDFLSWKVFGVLNRLTYLVYLCHVVILSFFLGSLQGVVDTNHHMVIWAFLGTIVMSFGAAYIIRIFFEAPMIELEKVFLKLIFRAIKERKIDAISKEPNEHPIDDADLNALNGFKIRPTLQLDVNDLAKSNGHFRHFTKL